MNTTTKPRKPRTFYVHNGSYVEHVGSLESCREYIQNVRALNKPRFFSNLVICIQRNNQYVPYTF